MAIPGQSVKMPGRMHFRRYMKMEIIVRLEMALLPETQIAQHLNMTLMGLQQIKRLPEYQAKRLELMSGVIGDRDREMRESHEMLTAELKAMVPQALGVYRQTLVKGMRDTASPAERRLALQASQDVMDREGTLAKVSRTAVTHEVVPVLSDDVTNDLLAAMQAAHTARQGGDSTVHDIFVKAAGLSKESEAELHRNIKLEDFNVKTETVQ